ncbi:acyl-CoA dehydrogenase family protein [Hymenobacter siberiensis]|uniref:acyl-CoA dehydrogenase family protein n=1 Tax=Hymenobacter siberiensis TaxID=2848396 RepID=UPI001C1E47CE|nr:acyl-CoA dehydrogenase family protein [Hymenobacter siberiensis]
MGRVFEGHTNALLLIQQLATAAQVAGYAADARAGRLFGVWNTENPADGVHLKDLPNGRYRLRGAKTFASGAGQLARPLITGALPHGQGWQLFVLPADAQPPALDRSFWQPIGMRATASFRADLTGLKIGPEDLIGPPNAYYQQPAFSGGAIRFAAVQLGGAEAAFDETRDFLRSLGRTDDPYQRQRLGEMAIMLESGRQWLRGGAENAARPSAATPEGAEATVAYANMMKPSAWRCCAWPGSPRRLCWRATAPCRTPAGCYFRHRRGRRCGRPSSATPSPFWGPMQRSRCCWPCPMAGCPTAQISPDSPKP